jgi:hypothetical protein
MGTELRMSRTFVKIASLAALAFALATSPSWAYPYAAVGAVSDFRVDWEQRQTQRGSVIAGYVHNDGGMTASKVSVLVEGLDGGGRLVSATIGYVVGTVPAFNRTYFEVRVPGAASYRVKVLSFEWIKGGAGM